MIVVLIFKSTSMEAYVRRTFLKLVQAFCSLYILFFTAEIGGTIVQLSEITKTSMHPLAIMRASYEK